MEEKYCEECGKRTPHSVLGKSIVGDSKQLIPMKRFRCVFCGSQFDSKTIMLCGPSVNIKRKEGETEK